MKKIAESYQIVNTNKEELQLTYKFGKKVRKYKNTVNVNTGKEVKKTLEHIQKAIKRGCKNHTNQ